MMPRNSWAKAVKFFPYAIRYYFSFFYEKCIFSKIYKLIRKIQRGKYQIIMGPTFLPKKQLYIVDLI